MKRLIFIGILLFCLTTTEAQQKTTTSPKQTSTATKDLQVKMNDTKEQDTLISLTSSNSYAAKGAYLMSLKTNHLRVTDPMVIALTERAKGKEVYISSSGIVGMPKRAYGFANGLILFCSTVSTSSGSTGGSSSVGSGGSISGIGSGGSFIGLNGKSPYAGLGMWGTSRGLSNYSSIK